MNKSQLFSRLSALTFALAATASQAAIDVSAVKTEIDGTIGPIGIIGGAVLLVTVAIASYMWVKRAIR